MGLLFYGAIAFVIVLVILLIWYLMSKSSTTTTTTTTDLIPIPTPVPTDPWKSYQKIWHDTQCPNIGGLAGSLDACKQKCLETPGCNALNYKKDGSGCALRACVGNVVPAWDYPYYSGYALF